MTTQKTLKRRIRSRAAKTGESYTAARSQVLRRASDSDRPVEAEAVEPAPDAVALAGMTDEALERGSGRRIADWLELLDAWGARDQPHPRIAAWLQEEHGIGGWWAQSVTVAYERARGLRAVHEQADGFSVSASRTVAADEPTILSAFVDADVRDRWLPAAPMRRRRTTAARTARFDWDDPPSRVVVNLAPKDGGRHVVTVTHEKLADARIADRMKAMWRERLVAFRALLEG